MIDFKNAFLALERLSQRTSNQVVQEAFPGLHDNDFQNMIVQYTKHATPWGFYASLDATKQLKFAVYLYKLIGGVPPVVHTYWISPTINQPLPTITAKMRKQYRNETGHIPPLGAVLKKWYIKNESDTLYVTASDPKYKGIPN